MELPPKDRDFARWRARGEKECLVHRGKREDGWHLRALQRKVWSLTGKLGGNSDPGALSLHGHELPSDSYAH